MKNLILTMSFFLLLPFTVHANGLMKFKKVKAGEAAPKIANRLPLQYVHEMRSNYINFLIKLEKDMESGKVTRSDARQMIDLIRSQLFVADALASGKLASGTKCFFGGWESTINSTGSCTTPTGATTGSCGANRFTCDVTLFGPNTCVEKNLNGFTARCAAAANGDTTKMNAVLSALSHDEGKLERLKQQTDEFCASWYRTYQKGYEGCAELKARVRIVEAAKAEKEKLARDEEQREADRLAQIAKDRAEADRIAQEAKAEADRIAKEAADKAEADRIAKEAADKAEADRIAAEKKDNPTQKTTPNTITSSVNPAVVGAETTMKVVQQGAREAAGEKSDNDYICIQNVIPAAASSCKTLLVNNPAPRGELAQDLLAVSAGGEGQQPAYSGYKPIDKAINFISPRSIASYLGFEKLSDAAEGLEVSLQSGAKACRMIASGCSELKSDKLKYHECIDKSEVANKRAIIIGFQKTIAIIKAAQATTKFEANDDYGGTPISCVGNKSSDSSDGGYAFDYPRCKAFVNWFTVLQASEVGFKVGNEAAVITSGMRNQTKLQQQIQEGNGQDAGLEAARLQAVEAQKAEERSMAFFSAKAAAIGAQLAQWVGPGNVCDDACCKLFNASGADKIAGNFFPNQDGKQQIIAQLVKAGADIAVAKLKADMHKHNARKVEAIKDQLQFTDESEEGVMKFCLQFPQDVRCLSPGERRALGASGTQFGGFNGSNFGSASLEGEQANDISAGQDFGGSLAAGGPSGSVGNIGNADQDAAAAKNIFNAPAAARGGGGGGAGAGAGGGGGGAGSASAGQLSRDEGLKEDKKESPIDITGKKAAYEGSKGGYSGGGYSASNKKPTDSPTANPFAGMFGKDKGRDPANVAEIDKPASDLFAKISRRYEEVQKRKALMDVAGDGSGVR